MKSQYNSTNFIVSNVFDIKTKKDHPYFDIIVLHKSIIYFLGYHKVVSINACFWYESNFFPACVSKQDGLVLGTLRYLKQALLFLNLQKIYKIIIEICYTRKLNNLNPVCTSSLVWCCHHLVYITLTRVYNELICLHLQGVPA